MRRHKPFVFLIVLWMSVMLPAAAQEASDSIGEQVDAYIGEQMRALDIPGAAVAVVQRDQIVYMQGYGIADPDGRAVTPQTPFWLASLSKSITATAIMQLVEDGQIDLNAPVSIYIPWFREGMNDPTPITVRMLLNQTSGFSRYSGNERIGDGDMSDDALERNVRRLSSVPLLYAPGEDWKYSNSNYDILGYLLQVVSGQPYERYIEENIFAPLNMPHSYTRIDQAEDMTDGFYQFWGSNRAWATPISRAMTPSAGLIASVEDLAHYVIAHLNGGQYGDTSILSAQGIAETHRASYALDLYNAYAFGWFVQPLWDASVEDGQHYTTPVMIKHDGAWLNFRTAIALVPAHDIGVITLTNTNDFQRESQFDQIAERIAALLIGAQPSPLFSYEDTLTQNGRLVTVAILVIQIVLLIASVINIARWRRSPRRWTFRRVLNVILLPLVFDALVAGILLLGLPILYETPLSILVLMTPDTGTLFIVMSVISVGWGVLRTVLLLLTLRSSLGVAGG